MLFPLTPLGIIEYRKRHNSQAKPGPELEADIKNFVKVRLAAHEYPREIEFVSELPLTNTGKIIRRELKAREVNRKKGQSQ